MMQKRGYSYPYDNKFLVTPPRTPISVAERIAWFTLLFTSITSVPAWILYHLRLYRGQTYDDWINYQNRWVKSG
uniref:Uncharacterized protein n=1 Tax=Tetranychus urticae TaxID=32264 RepID=T1JYQ8_TETUR